MSEAADKPHILLVTRSYPTASDLYRYPFVHRRVLAYRAAGYPVTVFRPSSKTGTHEFEGVTCHSGGVRDLAEIEGRVRPDVVAIHGLDELMWPVVAGIAAHLPVRAWLHGSEIPDFARQKAQWLTGPQRSDAMAIIERRAQFWRDLLAQPPEAFGLVLVSHHSVELMRRDSPFDDRIATVIHNPIDTDLFAYRPKDPALRRRVLFIRPFDSPSYGNDMAVEAIRLIRSNGDQSTQFTMIGDGPQFDEVMAPLSGVSGVDIQRRFLTQAEIAEMHRNHGLFLVPSRLDTQGVSRDEAMSSGLVPVTNRVAAVPEFVDEDCAGLAEPNDAAGIAERMVEMIADPVLFARRSIAAAERVRRQSGNAVIIARELALLEGAAHG